MNVFFLEKTSPSPTLPFCMKISWQAGEVYYSSILIEHASGRNLRKFLKTSTVVTQVDKICSRILWTWSAWHTCLVDIATLSCFNRCFSTNFCASPLPFLSQQFYCEKLSAICIREKFLNNATRILFWSQPSWKLRLQPIVASNFSGNPFVDGILGHNLLLSRALSVGIPSWMGF
jgi:hypothetical protein